ncbi:MAG: CMP-binding protein [Eubacteriaceae bacterium]|nr:CMP-binding protein [Eubacteriaceae bacterium]
MQKSKYFKGQKIDSKIYLIKKFDVKQAKNGSLFADMIFSDMDGEISAKKWDVSPEFAVSYDVGGFARVSAVVQTYNDGLQLIINRIEPAIPTDAELRTLIECAPYPSDKMFERICEVINNFRDEDIKKITLHFMNTCREKLMYYPAAKTFHHAVKGGLLYHMYGMLRSASALSGIYDFLNTDLLFSGVILHDIAKTKELVSDTNGIVSDYSAEGKLLGHITIMVCEIDAASRELGIPEDKALLLKHMVLSHHYEPEYGSPVMPMFAEAEMLHHLDMIDARMYAFKKTTDSVPAGTFAPNVWILDNRSILNHGLNDKEEK